MCKPAPYYEDVILQTGMPGARCSFWIPWLKHLAWPKVSWMFGLCCSFAFNQSTYERYEHWRYKHWHRPT